MAAGISSRTLTFVQRGAISYASVALFAAALMLFVVLSGVGSGGGPAITLPVGHNEVTAVPQLAVDPSTPDAHFSSVEFTAQGLSPGATLLYFAPLVLGPLAHSIIAIAIMFLARDTKRGRPFGPAVIRAITISAVTIAVIGMGTQVLSALGTGLARRELLGGTGLLGGYVPAAFIDWSPAFIAVALSILAAAFRHGERLQRDTDGLV